MPKMKTDSGAKKRFKVTGTGKLRRRQAFLNHILEKKTPSAPAGSAARPTSHRPTQKQVKRLLGI